MEHEAEQTCNLNFFREQTATVQRRQRGRAQLGSVPMWTLVVLL